MRYFTQLFNKIPIQSSNPPSIQATKVGTAECAERLNLTSRGNGKRSLESAVKMLISAVIFGICYFVSVFIAICSDLLLFDATSVSYTHLTLPTILRV